jgi:hypothetical protein
MLAYGQIILGLAGLGMAGWGLKRALDIREARGTWGHR